MPDEVKIDIHWLRLPVGVPEGGKSEGQSVFLARLPLAGRFALWELKQGTDERFWIRLRSSCVV